MKTAAIGLLPLLIGACAGPDASAGNETPSAAASASGGASGQAGSGGTGGPAGAAIPHVETYRPRADGGGGGGPATTYDAARASGILALRGGCLALRMADGSEPVLVFPAGTASAERNQVTAFGRTLAVGSRIEVGGSSRADPGVVYAASPSCPAGGRWFVAPGSLAPIS